MVDVDYEEYHRLGRAENLGDVYERVRARTLADIVRRERLTLSPGAVLLDAGAGEGRYLPLWKRLFPGVQIVALDVSQTASGRSAERHPDVRHVVATAERMPLEDASVDAVVSVEVLEHVPDAERMLREIRRVLKPGGWAVVSTPSGNRGSLEWWRARVTGNLEPGVGGGIRYGEKDDPTHLRRYPSGEFRRLCERLGFDLRRVWFNGHGFLWLGEVMEIRVKGVVDLGRRSRRAERALERFADGLGMLDWRLFKRLGFASTMVAVLARRDHAPSLASGPVVRGKPRFPREPPAR